MDDDQKKSLRKFRGILRRMGEEVDSDVRSFNGLELVIIVAACAVGLAVVIWWLTG